MVCADAQLKLPMEQATVFAAVHLAVGFPCKQDMSTVVGGAANSVSIVVAAGEWVV